MLRPDAGELRADEEDLGGVVDPDQENDQRAGGAVLPGDAALSEVQPDQELARREERRRDSRAQPDVAPADPRVGEELEHQRKERGQDRQGEDIIENYH